MLYDKNPPYPHYDHLPYAKEPWKSLYVFQRLFTTLLLVPLLVIFYLIAPRRYRPRASWSLLQIININFTRRIYKVTEVAGVTWGTRDPAQAPDESKLKEARFEWAEPLHEKWRTGIIHSNTVPFNKVGCYIWPKSVDSENERNKFGDDPSTEQLPRTVDVDLESGDEDVPLVGIFMHGGGYCHMSAHESSRTSRIPRGLIERKICHEVYSVEYRLLQHAPFPAVVQDAAAVYAHVIQQYGMRKTKCKLILIGDSSGGNLVLSLARWLRDEAHLPLPDGLLLLSPSSDPSQNLPETLSSYIPRPNKHTDYLVDTPEPRALMQRTFLGFSYSSGPSTVDEERRLMEIVHSEYVSPCSPIVLKRWGHEAKQDPQGTHEQNFIRNVFRRLPTDMRITRAWSALDRSVVLPTGEGQRAKVDNGPSVVLPPDAEGQLRAVPMSQEENASTSTTGTLVAGGGAGASSAHLVPPSKDPDAPPPSDKSPPSNYHATCRFPTLFDSFPRSLVVCGDAERLVREVRSLVGAMHKDGVDLEVCWAKDACHDLLIIHPTWWDAKVQEEVWEKIESWKRGFHKGSLDTSAENTPKEAPYRLKKGVEEPLIEV